jgi:ribonuclease P/MRP protein subunit RPP40
MGPGPQASHQKGASHEKEKLSFTFNLCGGGKKSEGNQGKDNGDRRKKAEVNEKNFDDFVFFLLIDFSRPQASHHLNTALGISGSIFKWIENWLQDREQKVVMLGSSSRWIKVKSGVPQGSVLGPLLFLIYINDIDEVVASKILKFADDTKLYGVVANQQDIERLKNDLKNLCNWPADWLMLFHVDKCKVMHFGYNNSKSTYEMNWKDLEEISEERDLGVIVQQDLKWSKQCSKSVSTANRILGMIKISFCYLNKDVVLKLYTSLVRPHLEYCLQAWRPYLKKDIELIEGIKRRATKLIKSSIVFKHGDHI